MSRGKTMRSEAAAGAPVLAGAPCADAIPIIARLTRIHSSARFIEASAKDLSAFLGDNQSRGFGCDRRFPEFPPRSAGRCGSSLRGRHIVPRAITFDGQSLSRAKFLNHKGHEGARRDAWGCLRVASVSFCG